MNTTGERIKNRRIELGMSADALAEKIGVNRSTIFRYEKGDIEKVPASVLEQIASVLRVSAHYLMGWTDERIDPEEEDRIRMRHLFDSSRLIDESILERMLAAGGKLPKENLEAFVQAMEMAAAACEHFKS